MAGSPDITGVVQWYAINESELDAMMRQVHALQTVMERVRSRMSVEDQGVVSTALSWLYHTALQRDESRLMDQGDIAGMYSFQGTQVLAPNVTLSNHLRSTPSTSPIRHPTYDRQETAEFDETVVPSPPGKADNSTETPAVSYALRKSWYCEFVFISCMSACAIVLLQVTLFRLLVAY